jgi:hypothetical protein
MIILNNYTNRINSFATGMMERLAKNNDEFFQSGQGLDSGNHSADNIFNGKIG